jgi:ribosomal protein S18 acetylase RimI-like enzyme
MVRRATADDIEPVARINVDGWRTAYRGILTDEYLDAIQPGDRLERVAQRLSEPDPSATFVSVAGDGTIGAYAGMSAVRDSGDQHPHLPTGELASLYADPAVRGRGAGFAVHQAGVEYLAEQGFKHAVVWVFEDNTPSRRFYEARGWACDGVTKMGVLGGARFAEVRYSCTLS